MGDRSRAVAVGLVRDEGEGLGPAVCDQSLRARA